MAVATFPVVAIPSSVSILKGVSVIHASMLLSNVTFDAGVHKTPPPPPQKKNKKKMESPLNSRMQHGDMKKYHTEGPEILGATL